MELMMCRACGNFVSALRNGDVLEPVSDECPDCGGTEFKGIGSSRSTDTRDE